VARGSGNWATPCSRMHSAILSSRAIVCAEGGGPGVSGPPPGMNFWHFSCAALNAGDELREGLARKLKSPPGFGSGKLGTPWERMQFANASAMDCGRLDEEGSPGGVEDAAARGPVELLRPAHAATSNTLAASAPTSIARARCILQLIRARDGRTISRMDHQRHITAP
jgi:hypothetical protein